jgi:hypothetical protein
LVAVKKDQVAVVNILLEFGADPNIPDAKGSSPLLRAVKNNQAAMVKLLLEHGANANPPDKDGWSLLHFAVTHNAYDVLVTLLQHRHDKNINIEAKCSSGKTPLMCAAEAAKKPEAHALAAVLLANKADVNARDLKDRSPLYFAMGGPPTSEREDFVRLLLNHGARLEAIPKALRGHRFEQYSNLWSGGCAAPVGLVRRDSGYRALDSSRSASAATARSAETTTTTSSSDSGGSRSGSFKFWKNTSASRAR